MKKSIFMYGLAISLLSCNPNRERFNSYSSYVAILIDKTSLENSFKIAPVKEISSPGSIYYKDNFIFIVEKGEGIHVINNEDPKNPQKISFLKIIGCTDVAIKNQILYANNATDILAIDLSDPNAIKQTGRIKNVIQEPLPPEGLAVPDVYSVAKRPANSVVIKWVKK